MSDVLSEVLRQLRLNAAVFLAGEFSAPWAIATMSGPQLCDGYLPGAGHVMLFHFVVSGTCVIEREGWAPVRADAGTAMVFPHGDAHRLGSAQGLPATAIAQVLAGADRSGGVIRLRTGGGGERTHIHCGFLACDPFIADPLLRALPDLLTVTLDPASLPWLQAALALSAAETAAAAPGSAAVLAKLAELLFVEAVRRYLQAFPEQTSWLAAVRDPLVSRALAALHAAPGQDWSVESLARSIGSSRSVLNERFAALLDRSPMSYLTYWRMQLAAQSLCDSSRPIDRVAADAGYDSVPAFTRAFARQFGEPPARWRRRQRSARSAS